MYYPHDNGQNCAYPLGHRVLAFAHDGVINASLLKCSGCKKTSSFLPQYINHHSACVRRAPRAFCFERHWAIGRESAPIPSVGIGTPHRHTSTLALVKFYPLSFSRLMCPHMGMKGVPDAPGELLSTRVSSQENTWVDLLQTSNSIVFAGSKVSSLG